AIVSALQSQAHAYLLGGPWGPDGAILLSIRGDLFRRPAGGGALELLGHRKAGESRRCWPQFLPDGRHYLYFSEDVHPEKQGIYISSLDKDVPRRVVASRANAPHASSPQLLFARES